MFFAAACAALAFGAGCASGLLPFTGIDAAASKRWPGITEEEVYRGRSLYRDQCSGCHSLHSPAEFSPAQWDTILPVMQGKARTREADKMPMVQYVMIHAGH